MQTGDTKRLPGLEAGQLWKLEHGYVYIVELGKRLIHYKMLRQPNQRAVLTQMIGIESLLNYLRQSEAELMPPLTVPLGAAAQAALAAPAAH